MTPGAESRIEAKLDKLVEQSATMAADLRHGSKRIDEHSIAIAALQSRGRYTPMQVILAVGAVVGIASSITGITVAIATTLLR